MLAIARRPFSTRITSLSRKHPTRVGRTCSVVTSCSTQIPTPLGSLHRHILFCYVLFKHVETKTVVGDLYSFTFSAELVDDSNQVPLRIFKAMQYQPVGRKMEKGIMLNPAHSMGQWFWRCHQIGM